MATIKDIAQLAGVSQGTVSNVLNGKGIVSSEKIKLVESAAASLGYTINERAKILRKGKSRVIAVILPNLRFPQYIDFFESFKNYLESVGYSVLLFISEDNPDTEKDILTKIKSAMAMGIAAFSCLPSDSTAYSDAGFSPGEVLFVERDRSYPCNYIGFDYRACGRDLARHALSRNMRSITLVTENILYRNEKDFVEGFSSALASCDTCIVNHVQTDVRRSYKSAFQIFSGNPPDGIIISSFGLAGAMREAMLNFYQDCPTEIITVSPLFSMPEGNFTKYELNYSRLGRVSAETLRNQIKQGHTLERVTLENSGFRKWEPSVSTDIEPERSPKKLHVLTLDSPAAKAMKSLSRIYTQATGIEVIISVFSYEEIHEVLTSMKESSMYDIIRLDVTWLPWFAETLLTPLEEIDRNAPALLSRFVEGLGTHYSHVNGTLYGFPLSPSNQLLFYRKDLFESTVLRRLYQETYKETLKPPKTFREYNRIAEFFTRELNAHSPVTYGSTITLGSTGVAATEFLTRYFARTDRLFSEEGEVLLTGPDAIAALNDLIELRKYVPEQYATWWTNAAQSFAQGEAAMTILYSNFASILIGRDSRVVNKIGFSVVPGANPIMGGGTLGVSKHSAYPKESYEYISWLCNEPLASAMTLLGSVPACRETYENYEIINTYPWLELAKDSFSLSRYRRTPDMEHLRFDERRFLSILGMAVKLAYSGGFSSEEAMSLAQQRFEKEAGEITGA